MYLTGETTEVNYGRIVHWKDERIIFGRVGQRLQFQPGHGLLVLEQQNRILEFLIKCCFQIFQDLGKDEILNFDPAARPDLPQAPTLNESGPYIQLSTMIDEGPYRLPTTLDTPRLLALVEARRNAAEDHIWDMREDPGYFASVLTEFHEHRPEILRDVNGKANPTLNDSRTWDRILSTAVSSAYEDLCYWNKLHRKIRMLASLFERHQGVLSPQQRLPYKLEVALIWVYSILRQLCSIVARRFIVAISCSHPKCARFARCSHVSPTTADADIFIKGKQFEPMLVLVQHLLRHEHQSMEAIHSLVDDIQYYLDHDPAQKNVFSSFVAKIFSDLALLTQIAYQIDNFYPWAPFFIHEAADLVHVESSLPIYDLDRVVRILNMPKVFDCNSLLNLRHKKFYYPIDKAHSAAQVEAMQKAEANLDEVWVKLDFHFVTHHPQTLVKLFKSHYTSDQRRIRRTPDYVPLEEDEVKLPVKCVGAILDPNIPLRGIRAVHEEPPKFSPEFKKTRIKTRGLPAPADIVVVEAHPDGPDGIMENDGQDMLDNGGKEAPVHDLGKRGRKVLATLFHIDAMRNQRGEIPWRDFLQVMTSLDFNAEKLYGSVWQFTPMMGSVKRGIHVHEPHPSGKIPFYMARMIGRRLIRTYGWIEDMIVVD